jgi:hypothetical protein
VVELNAIEFVLDRTYDVAVSFHLLVMAARVLHDLVDYELRVSPDVVALDAGLNGNSEATNEGLVFRHVVQRGEVQVHCIPHVFSEGEMKSRLAFAPVFITDPSK